MAMTRLEFVEKWRHQFGGMIYDAWTCDKVGEMRSAYMRTIFRKIDEKLAEAFDELMKANPPASPPNGGKGV